MGVRTHGETHILTPSLPFLRYSGSPTRCLLALPFSFFFPERIMMCRIIG